MPDQTPVIAVRTSFSWPARPSYAYAYWPCDRCGKEVWLNENETYEVVNGRQAVCTVCKWEQKEEANGSR
jgi:hypothetical protein